MGGYDKELISRLRTLYNSVPDEAGKQAIYHTLADGLIVIRNSAVGMNTIDKVRNNRNSRIDCKVYPEKVEHRLLYAYVLCNNIRTRRRRIAAETYAVHKAADSAGYECGIDGIYTVSLVLKGR